MPQDTPSTINAIHILKAEILSPDWRLSPKRNANCTKAMLTLNNVFNERRYVKGLVAIARQLLLHLAEENNTKEEAIDLLKEIMAHIVTFYEQNGDTLNEKKICAHSIRQFQKLNIPIRATKSSANKFAIANYALKQEVDQLQSLASQFNTLSATQQIQAMLTIQSLIAETKGLQKIMSPPT